MVFSADGSTEDRDFTFPQLGYITGLQLVDVNGDDNDKCFAFVYDQRGSKVSLRALRADGDHVLWEQTIKHNYFKMLSPLKPNTGSTTIAVVVDWVVYGIDVATGQVVWKCASPLTSAGWLAFFEQGGNPNYTDPRIIQRQGKHPWLIFEYAPSGSGGATIFCRAAMEAKNRKQD